MTRIQNHFKDHGSTFWLCWAKTLVTLEKAEKMGMGVWRKTPMDFFCVVPLKTCWPFDLSSWFLSTSRCWPLSIFLFNFLLLFESFQPFVESFHILTFSLLRRLTKLRSKMRKIFSEWKNYTKKLSLSFVEKLGFRKNKKRVGEKEANSWRSLFTTPSTNSETKLKYFFLFLIFC